MSSFLCPSFLPVLFAWEAATLRSSGGSAMKTGNWLQAGQGLLSGYSIPPRNGSWGWVSHSLGPQPKLPGGLTAVSLLLPNPLSLPFPPQSWEPVVDHTHTAQRSPGCVAGNPACSLLGRCSVQSPQLSPGEAPGPGFWSPQGWTERGFGPPGSNSVWQEDGCQQHRGGAETGLAGLPGARYFHAILSPKRHTERGGNGDSERDKEG